MDHLPRVRVPMSFQEDATYAALVRSMRWDVE
jgi:hypothetical protein